MQSFRTELENPVVEKDILDLANKIARFKEGTIDEEKFRSLRLARGVYGQRQEGVQMIRIKLPYGKVTGRQLRRIAQVSDTYSNGNLHITTRQDIQIHYVSLDDTPQLWADLEKDEVTLREACGNTVRNVTASEWAGIDPDEAFDVSPYAEALTRYFLRNPICQEMGRKVKIAFSSSEKDTALTFMHDLGFIPKLQVVNGVEKRGFKVLLGGGLGSQPRQADVVYNFLPEDEVIPFTEAVLRVFDRHGERNRRLKARLKFLLNEIGLDAFLELVAAEKQALPNAKVPIPLPEEPEELFFLSPQYQSQTAVDADAYDAWRKSNVHPQKQPGLYAVGVRVVLGNFTTDQARSLAQLIEDFATDELRFTLRQNLLIRNVPEAALPALFNGLYAIDLAQPGYNSLADITACPGTDTCNLGISNSTGIAKALETVVAEEYPQLLQEDIAIKISGCMNSCGQHMMAHIGFQGMTVKSGKNVAPALQVLLGGGVVGDGQGRFAIKVIKIPSKRGPQALRVLLDDYLAHRESANFLAYFDSRGERYFYDLLKPLADTSNLTEEELVDWGHQVPFKPQIGVGECAGVVVDLIATLFLEAEEKLEAAEEDLAKARWADSIYYSYAGLLNAAKALLLSENHQSNTQANLIAKFDDVYGTEIRIDGFSSFHDLVYQINQNKPNEAFATAYWAQAKKFNDMVQQYHKSKKP